MRTRDLLLSLWLGPLGLVACAPPAAPTAARDDRCAVWDRENAFAASVARHDPVAFAEHVHPRAVFFGDHVLRGRDAVVEGWEGIVKGEGVALGWRPESVDVIDDHTAVTRGPYWLTVAKPGASTPSYQVGTFQSTWVRDVDGAWRVAIDGGETPATATADDVKKLENAAPPRCPAT